MSLRTKLMLIMIVPILAMSLAMTVVITYQSGKLAREQVSAVEAMIIASKQTELANYVALARTAIEPFYSSSWSSTPLAKRQVSDIMQRMTFGQDGYFYVYQEDGTNIVHPRLPQLVGKNWIDLRDVNGQPVIADLIEGARQGGRFYDYVWNKPSTGADAGKLGYSIFLDKWGWMMGSGLYVDDIAGQVSTIRSALEANISQTRYVLLALTLGAILISGLFIGGIRLSEQLLADRQLRELASRLVDVQETERKRVSIELHDGISQLLVSARYSLDAASEKLRPRSAAYSPINRAMKILESAIGEVRRISMDLRPSILDDMGLAAAIKSLGKEFAEQTGTLVEVKAQRIHDMLGDEAKTALYRVAQEALTNVAKHANAGCVHIVLEPRGDRLHLEIADDGVGLPTHHAREKGVSGLGLRNMRERIEHFGGILEVKGLPGRGLAIVVSMPAREGRVAA